ncbi:MAG: Sensor protein, partial [uncultured bacterium]
KLEMDEKEIKKINLAHEKKVKELNCFYSIANLIYKQDITTDDFLSKVVSIIPTAWLYSSISGAKIKYKNKEYLSKDFRESVIKQSFEIKENEGDAVILEVYYLEKKSESDSDLFEKEFNLLEYIGKRISEILSSINSANTRRKLLETITLKNEELESIVYIASHDLRSPLVNIQGFRGELFNYMQEVMEIIDVNNLDEEKKERFHSIMETDIPTALNYIYTSANKMESLIRGLLKVSKLGSPELNPAQVDMNKLIKKILSSMQYLIRQKGVQVIVEDLPSCFADESQINQVFSNLCDNALKYLDKEKKSKIVISGTIGNNYSIYCVSDNGVGIPKEHQKKVFDIFYRLHTETAPGEGLGLTIVKRILDRNNGKITLESESGKGTDFYVYLPVSQLV